jgi:hypothetical protein
MERRFSIFGPLLLIATGFMWLLIQSGRVPAANLWALTYLWPLLLISAGLSLILRPYWKFAPLVLDVLAVGGMFTGVLFAGRLGWADAPAFGIMQFNFPGRPGSGNIITETRQVSGFHAIRVDYPAAIVIRQGATEGLTIQADDDVVADIRTEVSGGTLRIQRVRDASPWINPTKPVKITILVKELDDLDFSSAGTVTVESLSGDSLDLNISGAGTLTLDELDLSSLRVSMDGAGTLNLSGRADELEADMSGFGSLKAGGLQTQTAAVSISGAGSATVWVESALTAEISGAGSISYYGNPTVSKSVSGVGNVNSLGTK